MARSLNIAAADLREGDLILTRGGTQGDWVNSVSESGVFGPGTIHADCNGDTLHKTFLPTDRINVWRSEPEGCETAAILAFNEALLRGETFLTIRS
jgi:activator of HSP90 ATPase